MREGQGGCGVNFLLLSLWSEKNVLLTLTQSPRKLTNQRCCNENSELIGQATPIRKTLFGVTISLKWSAIWQRFHTHKHSSIVVYQAHANNLCQTLLNACWSWSDKKNCMWLLSTITGTFWLNSNIKSALVHGAVSHICTCKMKFYTINN